VQKNSADLNVLLYQLYQTTLLSVERARERARSDLKNDSRDWLRFFDNSRVLQILGFYSGSLPLDMPWLKCDLGKLRSEVHPQEPCDNRTDLEKIRDRLDFIVERFVSAGGQGASRLRGESIPAVLIGGRK
jgi:hypothetical protein